MHEVSEAVREVSEEVRAGTAPGRCGRLWRDWRRAGVGARFPGQGRGVLELDEERRRGLAQTFEEAGRALGAIRHGTAFPFGAGQVVLNPDDPLPSGGVAMALDGDLSLVEQTLLALPLVWEEAGRRQVVVHASPASAPELPLLAEECGYEAVEETVTMLLTDRASLAVGEPGRLTSPLPERDEPELGPLLARAHDLSVTVGRRMQVVQGHRLDDPRHLAFGAYDHGELVGVATGFQYGLTGQVVQVAVAQGRRRRRVGRALASAVAATLLTRGVELVWLTTEAGGLTERFFATLGFEPAYDAVTLTQSVD